MDSQVVKAEEPESAPAEDAVPSGFEAVFRHPSFQTFLQANSLSMEAYAAVPRYIRYPNVPPQAALPQLRAEFGPAVASVPWLPHFYSMPAECSLAGSQMYKSGQLYGMDAASGAAVLALDPQPADRVLDLCCAPGAKLCMIAEMMQRKGTLVGVDLSSSRLASCRKLLFKYGALEGSEHWRCMLMCGDGTAVQQPPLNSFEVWCAANQMAKTPAAAFETVVDSALLQLESKALASRARMNKSMRARIKKRQREQPAAAPPDYYDRVLVPTRIELVDAECSHDGSAKHLTKFAAQWGMDKFTEQFVSSERLEAIVHLQKGLLRAGWRAVRPGGTLVYSTCSFLEEQNEGVVRDFLSQEPTASLEPIGIVSGARAGSVEHTLRFGPWNGTSGLFIARFVKPEDS